MPTSSELSAVRQTVEEAFRLAPTQLQKCREQQITHAIKIETQDGKAIAWEYSDGTFLLLVGSRKAYQAYVAAAIKARQVADTPQVFPTIERRTHGALDV